MPPPWEEVPKNKHDLTCPFSPNAKTPLQESSFCFSSTQSLFQRLKEAELEKDKDAYAAVYSYSDAPQPPLSRVLAIIGVAHVSLSVVRRLVGDDDDLPDCLSKCTIAVKRGDGKYLKSLDGHSSMNSKAFARLIQRLRAEKFVAILASDKYNRFGILKPLDTLGTEQYQEEDFFCHCYFGKIQEVKQFLTQGIASTKTTTSQEYLQPPKIHNSFDHEHDPKPHNEWENQDGDNAGNGELWQPPGFGDTGTSLWQPPTSEQGDIWQPSGSEQQGESWQPYNSSNPSTAGQKRKLEEMDQSDANGNEFHANKGAAAADAFYSGLTRSLDTRADSRLFHMRAFNGWVKATQIQELDPKTKIGKKVGIGPMRVLDLACGKGGDLGKWVLHPRGVKEYVGSDVARGSLKDAAIRARQMRNRLKHCTFICADLGYNVPGRLKSPKQKLMEKLLTWSLHEENDRASGEPIFQMIRGGGVKEDQMFDVVSIQFAIHYMMQTRQRARRFFHTVSQLLEVGGNLIATTIDARMVISHLMNLGRDLHFDDEDSIKYEEPYEIKVGAGACRIVFQPEIVRKIMNNDDLFGLEYTFTLVEGSDHGAGVGDAVNLPEWLTPIPVLQALGEEVGLELESVENFHEFYAHRKDPSLHASAHSSLYSMKVMNRDGSISSDEWEISRMYCAVKFRKVREPLVALEDEDEKMEEEDDEEDDESEIDPKIKMKLLPMAMMKAKKIVGNDEWANLSSDEKTRLTERELRKLAKQ